LWCALSPTDKRSGAKQWMVWLAEWFISTKMDPDIAQCICDMLRVRERETKFANFLAHLIATVVVKQDNIGWLDLLREISAQWKEAQEVYYMFIGSNRSLWRWAQGLIQQLLSMVRKMWITWNAVVHKQMRTGD